MDPITPDGVDGAVVAGLAEQVRGLEEKVDAIGADVAQVPELATAVQGLAGQVDDLGKAVQKILDGPAVAAADWLTLDSAAADKRWSALGTWVAGRLVPGYGVTRSQLPDCWAMHTPVVVHMNWAYAAYQAAYAPRANPVLAAEWSTRWRAEAFRVIGELIPERRCAADPHGPGTHLGQPLNPPEDRPLTDEEEKRQSLEATIARQRQMAAANTGRRRPEDVELEQAGRMLATPGFWRDWFARARAQDVERRHKREEKQREQEREEA